MTGAVLSISPQANAQSFIGLKGGKKTTIKRLLPPAVNLTRKRIAVSSEGQGGVPADVATVLKTRVVTAIQRDPNFIVDEANPETRLSFKITGFRVEPLVVKDSSTNPPTSCTVFVGRADVSYQAIEVKTGIPQDSENLGWAIESDKPAHPIHQGTNVILADSSGKIVEALKIWKKQPNCGSHAKATQNEAIDELYSQLVHQVTQRAAPVDEEVEVGLPGGKLKDLSAMALDKRWPVLLESAEQMSKLEKPEDDASRLYLIALAHEALAYDARREAFELERRRVSGVAGANSRDAEEKEIKFFQGAKGHLEKAAQFYREAIAGDREEKELRRPEARVEYAVRLYATIERQRAEYEASRKKIEGERARSASGVSRGGPAPTDGPKTSQVPGGQTTPAPPAVAGPNAEIMKLCEEKLDEATILDFIQNAPNPTFDLSATGLVSLKRSCGDSTTKYVPAMRAKMTPKPRPSPAKSPAKPKPTAAASAK